MQLLEQVRSVKSQIAQIEEGLLKLQELVQQAPVHFPKPGVMKGATIRKINLGRPGRPKRGTGPRYADRIRTFLADNKDHPVREIGKAAGLLDDNRISMYMQYMMKNGSVVRVSRGVYRKA